MGTRGRGWGHEARQERHRDGDTEQGMGTQGKEGAAQRPARGHGAGDERHRDGDMGQGMGRSGTGTGTEMGTRGRGPAQGWGQGTRDRHRDGDTGQGTGTGQGGAAGLPRGAGSCCALQTLAKKINTGVCVCVRVCADLLR